MSHETHRCKGCGRALEEDEKYCYFCEAGQEDSAGKPHGNGKSGEHH